MISLLCPTRGRPSNMRRLVLSAITTAEKPKDIEVVFYIDDDDYMSMKRASEMMDEGLNVNWVYGPRIVLSECWNQCHAAAGGPYFMHCGDDIVFQTERWDSLILGGFRRWPDGICFVHGRDGIQSPYRLATHGFLHQNWVDAVGYFVPPFFSSDWNDVWLTEVADLIGRRVTLPEVFTKHMHPDAGLAEVDLTHRERVERGARDDVGALYARLAPKRIEDAKKLKARMIV